MKKSYPDWKILPAEVLLKIFQFAAIQQQPQYSSNVALVCKTWRNPAQLALYSHVVIYNNLQLEKFNKIVKCSSHFGTKVKTLDLKVYAGNISTKSEVGILTDLLSNYLPNLESLNAKDFHTYLPILNTLQSSKLKYLRQIPLPTALVNKIELANYASCVFLMKNQIEEVYISTTSSSIFDRVIKEKSVIKSQQLYDNLDQFNKLTKIEIRRETNNGVQVLEYVVETCNSLRNIKCIFSPINNNQDNSVEETISFEMMSNYTPNYNIKVLTIYFSMFVVDNCKVLLYIIHKFPQLQQFNLEFYQTDSQVNSYIILQLLNYIYIINQVKVSNLVMSQGNIIQVIEDFWNTKSKPGMENVQLFYYYGYHNSSTTSLDINKDGDEVRFNVSCCLSMLDCHPYMKFIEKNGNFIGRLTFSFSDPHENLLIHIFTHCPNLRNLHILGCTFQQESTHSEVENSSNHFIDELILEKCKLEPSKLTQLSTIVSEINQLRLISTRTHNFGELDNIIRIIMPHTRINHIVWSSRYSRVNYIRIFVVTEGKYYYYQVKNSSRCEQINAKEFGKMDDEKVNDSNYNKRQFVYICCQTKPDFRVNYK